MKSIYEYQSFRAFIRDLFDEEKISAKNVNMSQYARKFGMSGPALNLILSGKRNLTVGNLHQVARSIRLTGAERDYFETLVLWEQADHEETKAHYAGRLKTFRTARKHTHRRVTDKQLLSGWKVPALLIYLIDFEKIKNFEDVNYQRIADQFSISVTETKRLIGLFQKLGLLAIDPNEGVHIVFERVASQVHQKEFYRSAQLEILNRLDQAFSSSDAFFRATVFTISKNRIPHFRKDLLQLLDEYISDSESQAKDKVLLQGALGFFPVSPE